MIRALDRWLPSYLMRSRQRPSASIPWNIFISVCDHFEPFHHTDKAGALGTMADWLSDWPTIVNSFRDSSDRGPRHTFFYPLEQYDRDIFEALTRLCALTASEVEVHLHHEYDTAKTLLNKLRVGLSQFATHGLLSRQGDGTPQYGFIHGNWALDNSHPGRLHCGVSDELAILKVTGCYADFTFPSAPDPSQPALINSIYYAEEDGLPCSHHQGVKVDVNRTRDLSVSKEHLLMVQGPLGLAWRRRKWGVFPRLENADLTGANPPTLARFRDWMRLGPFVLNGPPWIFIKLHTHGGISRNYKTLLGDAARTFHEGLAREAEINPMMRYHYVTAREMVNLIHAAEAGVDPASDPSTYFDYRLSRPPFMGS